jgi:hypothetical protein
MKPQISTQSADSSLNNPLPRENAPSIKATAKGRIELVIDGVKLTGSQLINGKPVRLKKKDQDLEIEVDGQAIAVIEGFYATEGIVLEGQGWQFAEADSLKLVDSGVTSALEVAGTAALLHVTAISGVGAGAWEALPCRVWDSLEMVVVARTGRHRRTPAGLQKYLWRRPKTRTQK